MHDDASYHKSTIVSDFLKNQEVEVLQWPGNRPYLNPTEYLWKVLQNKVAEKQPSSAKQLVHVIKKVWIIEIAAEYCQTLIHGMPIRL